MQVDKVPVGAPVSAGSASDFHISELFFSRTDPRGVIRAGNSVFTRVSGYEWSELSGAPHKLVRHPDMPRAVFRLLWEAIGRGEPIGAYVKNRTKSGGHYWVFAVVMPATDGYLSVRLKPTSELLSRVERVYGDIRRAENDRLDPEASAERLLQAISGLGFEDYTAFMSHALYCELSARDTATNAVDDRLIGFERMAQAIAAIFEEANKLYADFQKMKEIPVNLRLAASRCEPSGGPISVISSNYSNIAADALDHALRFTDFAKGVLDQIHRGLFLMGAARLQREMMLRFRDEVEADGAHAEEVQRLEDHFKVCGASAREAVVGIADKAALFIEDCRSMRRFVSSLDVTRVTCMIETRWQADRGKSFLSIIDRLDAFHEGVEQHLDRIDDLNDEIIERTGRLLSRR